MQERRESILGFFALQAVFSLVSSAGRFAIASLSSPVRLIQERSFLAQHPRRTSQFAEANHPESHDTRRTDRARGQNFSIF
jgi:hypothetical protein